MTEEAGFAPHPEGGRYRRIWQSDLRLPASVLPEGYAGERSAGTCIAYVLAPGERSRWHRVRSPEIWLWQGGGTLRLRTGGTGPVPLVGRTIDLGPAEGDERAFVVAAGEWQSAEPLGEAAVQVACVVVPGFDWADWEAGETAPPIR
jgi:predicted cupin superfamily sugar epimerase